MQIAAAQRDPTEFAALYQANFDRVYAFVSRRTRSREDAEDITATVFHNALRRLPQFESRGVPFSAWLFRIATNELIGRVRRPAAPVEQGEEATADDGLEVVDRRAVLYLLVRKLPEDQRLVVVRRFIAQQSTAEIAEALGRTEGAVKQLQFRALTTLRSQLDRADA